VLAGLYLALVVAPNHIGMPMWQSGSSQTFVEQQVVSSRNVAAGLLCDFLFGGLNYQIEHHLFPSMPRNHFADAAALVRPFCAERGLPYTEIGASAVFRLVWQEARTRVRAHAFALASYFTNVPVRPGFQKFVGRQKSSDGPRTAGMLGVSLAR
jgi:fatty acid desaturase